MPFEFKTIQGVAVVVLPTTLDSSQGEELVARVEREIARGGQLIVDGSGLKTLTQQGVLHLLAVQRWTSVPERKRLPLADFGPTVWRAIVGSGNDFFFDSRPTLDDALKLFGVSAAPAGATAPLPAAPSPVARPPTEPFLEPLPNASPAPPFAPAALPLHPSLRPPLSAPAGPKSTGSLILWLSVAAVLLIAGLGAWWLFGSHAPVLTLSAATTTVEEDGKEADEITVQVQHGRLVEKSWSGLPAGLYFEPPADDSGTRTYALRGKAAPGATSATVHLEAVNDGSQRAAPVSFTVNVKEKPTAWQLATLQSLGLKAGQHVWAQSKFLVNADRASAKRGLPPGLVVERVPGKSKDWQLTGTPTAAGSYPVVFVAVTSAGKSEEQTCTLDVAAATGSTGPKSTAAASAPTAAVSNLDDGMRRFLLDRIENLPSYYTDQDRENLRAVVGTLKQARLVQRVVFEREGQTELSPDQSTRLKTALDAPENAALLKDLACQVVVVGYASKTGSMAANVRVSKLRARSVNNSLKGVIGHGADLCGDYGPTDVVDQSADETNRAVEVYAGILEPSSDMQGNAERFKQDFNRRHGIH